MAAEAPAHVYQPNWSKLSRDDVIDKVKGTLYGQAIGDAIGLATEFMSKSEIKKYYGKKGPTGYNDIIPDFHRARWVKGDWTDDTDQMLLILLGIVENKGRVLKEDFAKRMRKWMEEGFAELGDRGGLGIGMTTHHTICHKRFLEDPHKAAYDIWESSGFFLAANGAAMRTSVVGVVNFNDLDKVWMNTKEISLTTHADPRCTASCIAITTAIALILQGEHDPCKSKELSELVNRSIKEASEYVTEDSHKKELASHAMAKSWDKLELDDRKTMGYTYKTMGAGFYALRNSKEFRKSIMELIMQGGDADTNGAVAGALMGCKFGFKKLPEDLLNFPHRKWLDRKIQQFLVTIGLADEQQVGLESKGQKDDKLKEEEMDHSASHKGDTLVPSSDTTQVSHPSITDLPGDEFTTPSDGGGPNRGDDVVTTPPSGDVDMHPAKPPDDNVTNPDDVTTTPDDVTTTPDDVTTTPDDVTTTTDDVTTTTDDVTTTPDDVTTTTDDVTTTTDDVTTTTDDVTISSDDVRTPHINDITTPAQDTGNDDATAVSNDGTTAVEPSSGEN